MSGEERFLYLTLLLGVGAWQLQRQLRRQYCLYFSNVANVPLFFLSPLLVNGLMAFSFNGYVYLAIFLALLGLNLGVFALKLWPLPLPLPHKLLLFGALSLYYLAASVLLVLGHFLYKYLIR